MKTVLILGSGQNAQNTKLVTAYIQQQYNFDVINLRNYNFTDYDYSHENKVDDFLPLIGDIIKKYDCLIFCTPIYWYSMSALMKKFMDRMSDLLTIEKELGRKLRGKSLSVISCSEHDDQGSYFFEPFKLTANYLGMQYVGDVHAIVENGIISDVSKDRLESSKNFSIA